VDPLDDSQKAPHDVGEELTVRFCGGCNPVIDRTAVAAEAQACGAGADATLYVSGCVRACASGKRLHLEESAAVVVAGEHVDGEPTAAAQLAQAVKDRLRGSRTDGETGRPGTDAPPSEG
jgi:hypothetical protein